MPRADGRRHRVGFDRYSLLVDGRRLVLWSAGLPFHRLPGPSLWRDVLQKLRAHGHNAVSVPVPWNHHSPAPGTYDFTGVRDLNRFLDTAAEEGLYVVLRPGPYLGPDVDAGGLPGWLTAVAGTARTDDPEYLRHADEWLSAVNAIAVRHLYTAGGGTVLLYRIGDGSAAPATDPAGRAHLAHLYAKARADRIDVPVLRAGVLSDGRKGGPRAPGLRLGAGHDRTGHLSDLARGITAYDVPTVFGGTAWGWLPGTGGPGPQGSSAPLDEARRPTPELAPLQQFGHLVRTVPDLARLDRADRVRAADGRLTVEHLANPDTGTQVYVVRNDSGERVRSMLPGTGVEVPVTVAPHDAKLLFTGLALGRRKLAYTTAQPLLSMTAGRQDVAVFVGRAGETAQVVLDCETPPEVFRADVEPAWTYDRGRLNVVAPLGEGGLGRVFVDKGDSDVPLVLLFADDATALRLWPYETPSGSLLVYGPAMLRSATLRGSTVHLVGDVVGETGVEVWGPRGITDVTWNGHPVRTYVGRAGSLVMEGMVPDAPDVPLPELGGWRRRAGDPEGRPGGGASAGAGGARPASRSTTPVPGDGPVLFADDYGFHYGDVWYRGRLTDTRGITSVSLSYSTGPHGLLMAWLDGRPLGTHRMPAPDGDTADRGTWTATATFTVPEELRGRGRHVLSVLVRPMQHDGDERTRDAYKAARGLTAAAFGGGARDVEWRIQGAAAPDRARGPLNNGGLHGEREGWHLPGHDDRDWRPVDLPRGERRQGVAWYRTGFRLDVDPELDASVGLVLEDDPERAYRVQVFLNGWNMGQYLNDAGTGRTFVLPNGILRTRGANTLALAVLSDGTTPAGPGTVRLTLLGAAAGGVPVEPVETRDAVDPAGS
ncbi:beta-galactosidase [Streptomyces pilosus]